MKRKRNDFRNRKGRRDFPVPRGLFLPLLLFLILGILGVTILVTHRYVETRIREQIAGRDGRILHAVVLMQQINDPMAELPGMTIDDSLNQFNLLVETSQLKDVVAARLFNAEGEFLEAFPFDVIEGRLNRADVQRLQKLQPVCHFYETYPLDSLKLGLPMQDDKPPPRAPILEVNVPLHAPDSDRLSGIAQYLIDGTSIHAEFARLRKDLQFQSLTAFFVGGLLISVALVLTFRKLEKTNHLLEARTASLLHANEELNLAAKSSAVGAITAHLFHGLKNPVAGLQQFIKSSGSDPVSDRSEEEWREAVATTDRISHMVNEVVRVLRENEGSGDYEISLSELIEMLRQKFAPVAADRGIHLLCQGGGNTGLDNRTANLLSLILSNLLDNAIRVTPKNQRVQLTTSQNEQVFSFEVSDDGPGIPPAVRENLFTPCRSNHPSGCGIGLAISRQLANHLGARLEMASTGPHGTRFSLQLPTPHANLIPKNSLSPHAA